MASSLSSPSSSTRKLKASKQAYLNDSFTASSDSETDYSGSSEEISDSSGVIGDALFAKPTGNYIINPSNIQELLQTIAVCKVCHSDLQIVEKMGSKQGLGAMWSIHCLNKTCTSHLNTQTLPITPKSGKIYEINRASVIGFRAIGKSFFGLAPIYTWYQHTKVIEEKVKDQSETDFSNAVSQLKQFKLTIGEVDRTEQELADKVYTIP